jgi:molecular chaperone DnaK (HSP70)
VSTAARYLVGIDLGTSNTALAYAELVSARSERPRIEIFNIPQLTAPGEVQARSLLPSFRYHPAETELSEADQQIGLPEALPELALPNGIVGSLAEALGSRVPGRLVSSAKSWLCHGGVERRAPILPWGAPEGVPKISPVAASASYLGHLRVAWDAAHPDAPLAQQELVLTVPASFDEGARTLTLEAAQAAGLPAVRLLEEPQAAVYDFIDRQGGAGSGLEEALSGVQLVLVLDVGGGTTDLTLVRVELRESGLRMTRIAVGDHLMLGGDNMDHALARLCEPALAGAADARLPVARFAQLIQQCRAAKERLLAAQPPEHVQISLLGAGSSIMQGSVSTQLTRQDAERAVVDGFFPVVPRDAEPAIRRAGLVEFGLPFAADPVITRHVAAFLKRQSQTVADALGLSHEQAAAEPLRLQPDAVLLNGGVFRSYQLQQRMLDVLGSFRGQALRALDNPEPELAVARGAVAYSLARRGIGLKIGGGSARSYYMLVKAQDGSDQGVCVLPRGAEEGEAFPLPNRSFALRIGQPVRFRLLCSNSEQGHRPGLLITPDEHYQALPDIAAVIDAKAESGGPAELEVALEAQLTEVGTLEMSLLSTGDRARRFQLEFQLRADSGAGPSTAPARITQLHARFPDAVSLLSAYYGKAAKDLGGRKINTLRQDLEKLLGERERWDTPLLRELFGQLLAAGKRRRRSADHERLWFHLSGYCLRPGFGYPVDAWRVDQLWAYYAEGVQFAQDPAVWSQWWILWRRIAGGLDQVQHERIYSDIRPYLEPPSGRGQRKPKNPRAQGLEDMVRLAASLERLSGAQKRELGEFLLARLAKGEISQPSVFWSLGRLGARAPFYGSAHTVASIDTASEWLERLLAVDLRKTEQAAFAVTQLARLTGDRARDVSHELRMRAAEQLGKTQGHEPWIRLILEGGELSVADAGQVFGESLPSGLRLIGG